MDGMRFRSLCANVDALSVEQLRALRCRLRSLDARRAAREPTEFHVADVRADFEAAGHRGGPNYLPTLLMRFKGRGIIEAVGYGRYRVNREHLELVG